MVHKPKVISTQSGCALPTATKTYDRHSDGIIILTEIWNEMSEDWKEGEVVIARPGYKWVSKWQVGKPYVIVKYYDDKGSPIGIYCDVCHPVRKNDSGLEYFDLYLDVWQPNGGTKPRILDEDELQEAFKQGYISKEEFDFAHSVARELIDKIKHQDSELQF